MADNNSILALNLGSQRVGMARFQVGKKGGITLRDFAFEELPGDVTSDMGRVAFVKAAVKSLAKQLKATAEDVIYAIPSQNVITRPVKLPALGADQADKIVGFEAQQAVPFPLSETVWDYQVLSNEGPESEVLIAAVRSEQLEEINAAVEAAGLKPVMTDAAPFALYNAFRHNYGAPEQSTLLLDMGARTTDAIFMEGEKVFIASFPNAGGHVTQTIAREMGTDYDGVEEKKKEIGFVNLGGNYADHEDPEVDSMSKIIRNQFTRLHAEINRRVQQYRQQGGTPPAQIYLAGGASAMPYTKEFFEEKFRVPVEWFNALGNVPLGPKVDAEYAGANGHTLGELVGLALRSGKEQPLHLDLCAKSVDAAKDLASKKPKLFIAAALLLGSLAGWWVYSNGKIAKKDVEMVKLEKEFKGLKGHADEISAQQSRGDKANAWYEHLHNGLAQRQHWLDLYNLLNKQFTTNDLWLTQISPLDAEGNPLADPVFAKDPVIVKIGTLGLLDKTPKAKPLEDVETMVDSLLVSGLWQGAKQELPKETFLKFKDLKDYFDIPDGWDKDEGEWFKTDYSNADARWASSFQMRLKLKTKLKTKLLPDRK
jgi:type IV pilus assembly protein PilM